MRRAKVRQPGTEALLRKGGYKSGSGAQSARQPGSTAGVTLHRCTSVTKVQIPKIFQAFFPRKNGSFKNVTVKHVLSYHEQSRWRPSLSLNARPSFAFSATTPTIEAARLGMGVGAWGSVMEASIMRSSGGLKMNPQHFCALQSFHDQVVNVSTTQANEDLS